VNETQGNSGTGAAKAPDFSSAQQSGSKPGHPTPAPDGAVAPVIRVLPLTGFRKTIFKFGAVFGVDWRPSRLSRRDERIMIDAYAEDAAFDAAFKAKVELDHDEALAMNAEFDEAARRIRVRSEARQELRDLTTEVKDGAVLYLGAKGSSATTTTAVHASAVHAEFGRILLTLVDGNPAAGLCAARLGMNHGDTITIQQLAGDLKGDTNIRFRRFKDEMRKARPSVNGVRVVGADNIIDETRRLSGSGMSDVLTLLDGLSEFIGIDTANDVGDMPTKEAAKRADCYVFTANAAVQYSLRLLSLTMETLRGQGTTQAAKVNRSVVVISNIPKGKTAEDYRFYLNEVDIEDNVVRKLDHLFDGVFMGVQHDEYLALDRVVDLDKLDWATLQAYFNLVISTMKQIRAMRDKPGTTSRISTLAPRQAVGDEHPPFRSTDS
jgi:MinD-like ATPase involved in chromosome partitioning or flagellar assembly